MADLGKKIFYKKAYTCLYCFRAFEGYRMYPSASDKYERTDAFFDIPYYLPKEGEFTNYLEVEVKVCPGCAYASNDDGHFFVERSLGEQYQPEELEKQAVLRDADARRALAVGVSGFAALPRALPDALLSYRLAIHSSNSLFTADSRRNAIEMSRMANYALKGAQLCERADPAEMDTWRREALDYLTKAFELEVRGATRYRAMYQLAALGIYFHEDKTASRCLQLLKDLSEAEPARDLFRYLERLRKIWQDRELYRRK